MSTDIASSRFVTGEVILRVSVAGLSAAMALIHLVLWEDGVRHASVVGPLFLLNVIGGFLLALAVLASPRRLVSVVAILNGLFNAGTLIALFIAIDRGLFGFRASWQAPHIVSAISVEALGVVASAILVCFMTLLSPQATGRSDRRSRVPAR